MLYEVITIPHGRIKGLKEAVGALVRMKQPIPFDAPDGQAVSLIFVLLVPDRATDAHLQILSELAQMFSDRPFRERLLTGRITSYNVCYTKLLRACACKRGCLSTGSRVYSL